MDIEAEKDRRALESLEALTQRLAEVRRDSICERTEAAE